MFQHNRCGGYISRIQVHNIDLSIYGPQAGRLHYRDPDNGGSGGSRRCDDDDATDDDLCSGSPIWHAPADLTREPGSMLLGTSLL